jgi:hypothetical protein
MPVYILEEMPRFTLVRVCALHVCALFVCNALARGASLLNHELVPGRTAKIEFPVDEYFQNYAAEGGNPKPGKGLMVMTVPRDFTPSRSWPVLIVTSTTDANRTSPMDAKWYEQPALKEGWIVLATDAAIHAQHDSTPWRLAMTAAALQDIRREWPQSAEWPVAFAGLSGGAKRSGVLGAMLAKSRTIRICGFFLAGINEDRLTPAYREFQPPPAFLNVPIWLSVGMSDRIAPLAKHEAVQLSLQHAGFTQVKLGIFDGRHEVNPGEVQRALRWFREFGKF